MRWDTRKPRPSVLVSSGGEMRIYYPEAAVVEVHTPPKEMLELSGTPLPRLAALGKRFDLKEIDAGVMGGASGDKRLVAVELTPKDDELKEHIESVRVLLDAEVPCVKRLTLVDPDGETTEIEFRDLKTSTEVRDEELELNGRCIELRIEAALESQRGETICFFRLASVIALRVVCGARARELGACLGALELDLLAFLRQLQICYASLGLSEIDVPLCPEPVEQRPLNLQTEVAVGEPAIVLADARRRRARRAKGVRGLSPYRRQAVVRRKSEVAGLEER